MPKLIKPLTNTQVASAKNTEKPQKLADGGGLYLYISPTNAKSWRIDYRHPVTSKRLTMTLGQYPQISLADARAMRTDVQALLARDIDPIQHRKDIERQKQLEADNTFESVALEYLSRQIQLSPATIRNNTRYMRYLLATLGNKPISQITPIDVLDACRKHESKGFTETAHKMKSFAGQVFRYAVQTSRAQRDVTQDLKGALVHHQQKHYSAIIDPVEFGRILRAIDSYHGRTETRIALQLIPLLFVRSGELRHALWDELDFEKETWTFTPRKTRRMTGISLIVPLPKQAMTLLKELEHHKRSNYLFPSIHTTLKPLSESTLIQALKRIGFDGTEQTIHGFRASARTMIVEHLKYPEALVEMQLGHKVRDMHGRAYNRVTWLDERREMMQAWANYLDELKAQSN